MIYSAELTKVLLASCLTCKPQSVLDSGSKVMMMPCDKTSRPVAKTSTIKWVSMPTREVEGFRFGYSCVRIHGTEDG